jgi:hypothetical protein
MILTKIVKTKSLKLMELNKMAGFNFIIGFANIIFGSLLIIKNIKRDSNKKYYIDSKVELGGGIICYLAGLLNFIIIFVGG